MPLPSKTAVDRAGSALAKGTFGDDQERQKHESVFDQYRQAHIQPLTEITFRLQSTLSGFGADYYIAQRLKRKPQILKKLKRLHVRLSQLQDIGGARIVVKTNGDVDRLHAYLVHALRNDTTIAISRTADYRQKGREQTGYRALHLILHRDDRHLELQLRSEAQHLLGRANRARFCHLRFPP